MKLIAMCGHAGCGKDTAADHLESKYGFEKLALSKPIKKFGERVFDFSSKQLYGPSACRNAIDERYYDSNAWDMAENRMMTFGPTWVQSVVPDHSPKDYHSLVRWFDELKADFFSSGLSPRIMLQRLGTEWGRNIDKDIWSKAAIRTARSLEKCVITDVRFFNEVGIITKAGGKVIRIHRDETDDAASLIGIGNHSSEAELIMLPDDMFDVVMNNNKSLSDFIDSVDNVEKILFGD